MIELQLGMLDGDWLEKSGFLAAAGTMVGGNLRFSAKQLGVLDVLLSALPPADTDAAGIAVDTGDATPQPVNVRRAAARRRAERVDMETAEGKDALEGGIVPG